MRFCDKLLKLRKNNNMSQEQLADRLSVSRQAVSKWESGQSYPDMDKMIQMCNILNCTLEDLLDDGTIGKNKSSGKINFNNYFNDFLNFITKTSNMFSSMTFKQKMKCIFEMLILSFIIMLIGFIFYIILNKMTFQLISLLPTSFLHYLYSLFSSLYFLIIFIISIIILIHLFKIRYLDYFITIEDQNVKERKIEEPIDKIENNCYAEKSKEKIIIRDPKHSTISFFEILIKIILIICKAFAILSLILIIFILLGSIIGIVMSLFLVSYGILFIYISICFIGLAFICYQLMECLFNFIFNIKISLKRIFIVTSVSILVIGVGIGMSITELLTFNYINESDKLVNESKMVYIDIDEHTILFPYLNNIEYIIDNSLPNIKLEINSSNDFYFENELYDNWEIKHIYLSSKSFLEFYNDMLNDIKNKNISSYDEILKIKIYLSQSNYDLLKQNYNSWMKE